MTERRKSRALILREGKKARVCVAEVALSRGIERSRLTRAVSFLSLQHACLRYVGE